MLLLPYSTTLYITHTSGPQSAERHSTSPESLIHGRPKPAGCRRPRSVRLFVFLQHPEDLFASFACNWLFVKLTYDICHNHHNRLCKILLAQCRISQLEHEVKTQCKNLLIVLSRIYALSSENFLGLNLGLCKKNTNIRYGWTFNVSNLIQFDFIIPPPPQEKKEKGGLQGPTQLGIQEINKVLNCFCLRNSFDFFSV